MLCKYVCTCHIITVTNYFFIKKLMTTKTREPEIPRNHIKNTVYIYYKKFKKSYLK